MGNLDKFEEKDSNTAVLEIVKKAEEKILTEEELGEDATCCTGNHEKNVYNLDAMACDLDSDPEED